MDYKLKTLMTMLTAVFKNAFVADPDTFWINDKGTYVCINGQVNDQLIQPYMFWGSKSSSWLVSGISRTTDRLEIFRAKKYFGKLKRFFQFQLVHFEGESLLAVFSSAGPGCGLQLHQLFPLKQMVPASAESKAVPAFEVNAAGTEFTLEGADFGELYKLKKAYSRAFGLEPYDLVSEVEWVKRAQEELSQKTRDELRDQKSAKLAKQREQEAQREALMLRPKVIVYGPGQQHSCRPITAAEYSAKLHKVFDIATRVVVVESYEEATGKCGKPEKVFRHARVQGQGEEFDVVTEGLTFEWQATKSMPNGWAMPEKKITAMVKGQEFMALVVTKDELASMRANGVNGGTPYVLEGERDPKGRPIVYRLYKEWVDTVGPADSVRL